MKKSQFSPLLILFLLALGHPVHSQELSHAETEEIVHKLEKVRTTLNQSMSTAGNCDAPQSPHCRFENYCEKLEGKAQDFYLYQDSLGHQIPNFSMMTYLIAAELCVESPFPLAPVSDPFAYPEQFLDEKSAGGKNQLQKNKSRLQAETQRVKTLFSEVQQKTIRFLQAKKNSGNSAEIENMISRIRAVRFRQPNMTKDFAALAEDGCESPNAYFDPKDQSITVCPQLMNMPDAAIFYMLTHEFGHSIDSCALAYNNTREGRVIPEWMNGAPTKEPIMSVAVPLAKNPFKSVLNCLQSQDSIGVKTATAKELLDSIDQDMNSVSMDNELRESSGEENYTDTTEALFEDQKQNVRDHYEDFKHCSIFAKSEHMQEAFSDWLATQILAEKIATIPEATKAREFAFTSLSPFYALGCKNIQKDVLSKLETATGHRCEALTFLKNELHDDSLAEISHPKFSRRANKIVYAKPEIRKALGCQTKDNGKDCK